MGVDERPSSVLTGSTTRTLTLTRTEGYYGEQLFAVRIGCTVRYGLICTRMLFFGTVFYKAVYLFIINKIIIIVYLLFIHYALMIINRNVGACQLIKNLRCAGQVLSLGIE